MNLNALERFAIRTRKELKAQIEARLNYVIDGDSAELRGMKKQVDDLQRRIKASSKEQVIEEVAYTWFNRLAALRVLDARDFHPFQMRVLMPAEGMTQPELFQNARQGIFPDELKSLNRQRFEDLLQRRLPNPNPEAAAYRMLLVAVCNAYHRFMPFLFEPIADHTELLLPEDLLTDASLAAGFRSEISDEDCAQIEIIGWLYQFYISEKKDEVIGKVVKSEDIPAATQLFTPNWIVKYMVQNSLGAQWLATYPQSPLKGQMEYYIEPAEQTDEVNAQLAAITPSQLNPEELTLIDPACGSGHILIEAYDHFKWIYLERGYALREIPKLILEKNLFGLDICPRAAQLTHFALMMKGRADDRRLFERGVKLNVMALVDSAGFDAEALAKGVELGDYGLKPGDLTELKRLFEHATTFGSLIQVPEGLAEKLPALKQLSEATSQDLFVAEALKRLGPLVQQAELLAAQYDSVVANPPYMGGKYQTPILKNYLKGHYVGYEKDFFSAFINRGLALGKPRGRLGFMSPFVWMFISSYEPMRNRLINKETITSLVQLEYSGFEGATVPICTFTLQKGHVEGRKGCFIRLSDFGGSENQGPKTLEAIHDRECGWFFEAILDEFEKIPGSPVAYWVSEEFRRCYEPSRLLSSELKTAIGLNTGDNNRFLRVWHEVGSTICLTATSVEAASESGSKWFPYSKGGSFRKWYGNREFIANWENDGAEMKEFGVERNQGKHWSRYIQNLDWMFRPGITWTFLSSSRFGVRFQPAGSLFDVNGSCAFPRGDQAIIEVYLGLLCSPVAFEFLKAQNPTLAFQASNLGDIPWHRPDESQAIAKLVTSLVQISKSDWNAYERSWEFQSLPLLTASTEPTPTLESSYTAWITQNKGTIAEMKRLEEENNRLFIDAYGLQDELTPDVPIEQITLTVNPAYRYGGKLTEEEQWTRFRQDTMEELVSYAIGCMMGRYSLEKPGLILADTKTSQEEHLAAYAAKTGVTLAEQRFPVDEDGILPLLDDEWFEDDVTVRVQEFLEVVWGQESLTENLRFLEEGLGKSLRKYLLSDFWKTHLQNYKKRPIYWLVQSPKKSFQALIYLHRYTRNTFNQVLSDYLRPYLSKLRNRQETLKAQLLSQDKGSGKLQKELQTIEERLRELEDWERKVIHPLALEQKEIDLDDGVKVNYPKFYPALAKIAGL